MFEWLRRRDRASAQNSTRQTPSDDRLSFGISREEYGHWGKVQAEFAEFLHEQKKLLHEHNIPDEPRKPDLEKLVRQIEEDRALYEQMCGLVIVAERPNEYALALVLRPFSRPPLNGEISFITASRLSPGYCFIGLERDGEPAVPAGLVASRRIASAADLKAAIEIAAATRPNGFVFFQAADEMWKDVVTEFARSSAAILLDLSESAEGLEWEFETLVPKYAKRFVCYAIDAESRAFGPWQDRLPAGLEVHPILTWTGQTVASRIFSDLLVKRASHDKTVASGILAYGMDRMPWGRDLAAGLEGLAAGDLDNAIKSLKLAWDCATRLTSHPLGLIYPGLAYADALTLIGDRPTRHGVLKHTAGGAGGAPPSTELERHGIDVRLIRQLLGLRSPELPLAIWQYYSLLGGGLSSELYMTHHYLVSLGWDEWMGRPDSKAAAEMHSWHADEAVLFARKLKAQFIEMEALLPAALARRTLGDDAGCVERARAGAKLAALRGDASMAEGFRTLLTSGT